MQVSRNAGGGKPPQVRKRVEIAGRFIVYLPNESGLDGLQIWKSGRRRQELEASLLRKVQRWTRVGHCARKARDGYCFDLFEQVAPCSWAKHIALQDQAPKCVLRHQACWKECQDRGADGEVIVDDRMTLLDLEKKLAGREIKGSDELLFHDEREPLFDAYGVNDGPDEAQSPVVLFGMAGELRLSRRLP